MKTKIIVFLMIVISIMLAGTINVKANSDFAHSAEKLAEILDATYNGNVVTLQKDVDLIGGEYGELMWLNIRASEDIILDLNSFSIRGVEIMLNSDLHIKNGTFYDARISYWNTLTIENATVRGLDGQAESFTNIKGTTTLSGITLGNTTIEKDATLVVDERDFEFGYHNYNENGHLLTNNGTILIKDENSEFKIEQGNTLINNGSIENNGTYINEGKTKYAIIIENIDGCEIASNVTIAEKGEKIQLTLQHKEGYIFQGVKAYKLNDKNTVVKIENDAFTMPDYCVVVEAITAQEQYILIEGQNNKFTINSNQNLIFKTDGKFNLFDGIKIDNNLISKENYKVEEGSTVITLNASYLNSLAVGKHKLDILYTNGTVVNCDFEILSSVASEKDETPKMGSATTDNKFLFIGLIVMSLIGLLIQRNQIKRKEATN